MADQKLTDLAELTSLAADDLFLAVDVSDTTMAASGTDKRVKKSTLDGIYGFDATANQTISGEWTFSAAAGVVISGNGGKDTLAISNTAANVGITLGGDNANLYRPSANKIRTDATEVFIGSGGFSYLTSASGDLNLQGGSVGVGNVNISASTLQMTGADKPIIWGAAGTGGAYIQFGEQSSDPGAPGANLARLFAKDNGAGKTQLVVRFPTGATQVIATEP